MSIYTDMQELAADLLSDEDFDQKTVVFVETIPGAGPADNPGTPTITTTTLNAVVKGVGWKYQQMGFVPESDLEVTAAVVAGLSPAVSDLVDIDSVQYKIVADMSVPAANTRVVWKFIVRKVG